MSEHRIFIKRIGLVAVAKFITGFRGLLLLPLLSKTIGAAQYGVWSQILITIGLLTPFLMLNLATAAVRFLPAEREAQKVAKGIFTVMFSVLAAGACCALALFLFSDYFAGIFLQDPSASFFIKLAALVLVLEALSQTGLESFRIFGQIKKYSLLTITQTGLEIGLIGALVFSGFGLLGALLALAIVRTVILAFSLYAIILHTGFAMPDFSLLRPYLVFGLPLLPISLFDILINSSDRYIIGFFKGAAAVGIYSATYSIGFLAIVFIFPIAYILSPTIFKLFDEGNIEEVKRYLAYSLKYFLLFSIPSIFGLTILATTILKTLATSEFVLPNSALVVLLVATSAIFYGLQTIYGQIIMIKKNTTFFIFAFGAGLVSNVILNILLIPYFGVVAAAFTTLLAYGIVALLMYGKSRQHIIFKVDIFFILKSIAASLVMSVGIYAFSPTGLAGVAAAIIGGAGIYGVVLWALGSFTKAEMSMLASVFNISHIFEKY